MLIYNTYRKIQWTALAFFLFGYSQIVNGQCEGYTDQNLSPKIANYVITADLDRKTHTAKCTQKVTWTNTSPEAISELRFYMYMNAFKDRKSTYLKGINNVFGDDLDKRKDDEWGRIEVTKTVLADGTDITSNQKYIQPNDNNEDDETVLSIALPEALAPGSTITLDMEFYSQLPKTIVRAGWGKNDFHLFVHWFPQMGVYEKDRSGSWGWNCHQFMQKTEFYADFGNYDVTVITDKDFVVGGSGCRVSEKVEGTKKTTHFIAHDLIDFGWTAYPLYETYTEVWNGVDIELLVPGEHCGHVPRYLKTIKDALAYLDEHVGPYYYPKITIVDPPVHSMRSGFMEYPMMITCASVYGTPKQFRGVESLVIHEFAHMYFMGTLASNEKEEAWLDEGFVTFFEDEILDHYYGEKRSFYDFGGFRTGNAQKSRQEYTTLRNPKYEIIAKPGWENKGYYKALTYGKTATVLRTFKNIIGAAAFETIIKQYYQAHKFSHPREADWLAVLDSLAPSSGVRTSINHRDYFHQALHTNKTIDYEVVTVDSSDPNLQKVTVRNNGDFELETEVVFTLVNGDAIYQKPFSGKGEYMYELTDKDKIKTVHIDPDHKILLDLNYINNSYTAKPDQKATTQYAGYGAAIGETIFHLLSFLL